MSPTLTRAIATLKRFGSKERAANSLRFFKTGKGQYGEGDIFIGATVPEVRSVAKQFEKDLTIPDALEALHSPLHEVRLFALYLLVAWFKKGDEKMHEKIARLYLKQTKYINNWDLVDTSAYQIIGGWLEGKPKDLLFKLAKSPSLWERRIAIVSTFHDIRQGEAKITLELAKIFLTDKEDLMHKATGWMLREVGKNCPPRTLEKFLDAHATTMPRTMLRYAIERFPEAKRKKYMRMA